jgi:hypothetical protein
MAVTTFSMFLVLSVFLPADTVLAASEAAVGSLIEQAEEKQEQARRQGHAWSATNDYIAEAHALLKAGKTDDAESYANRALRAAEASLKQAADEANAWQSRAPRL